MVSVKIDGELELFEPRHVIGAHQMSLAVGDNVLHVVAVCNAKQTDDVGV